MKQEKLETATVKIEEEISQELRDLIKKVARLAEDEKISVQLVTKLMASERNLYKESKIVIPEETEIEKDFRNKARTFFVKYERYGVSYYGEVKREIVIAYEVEIACAAYKIYQVLGDISPKSLYDKAKERLPKLSYGEKRCLTFKIIKENIVKILEEISEENPEENLPCEEFLKQYDYRTNSAKERFLKLIFLIQN